MDDARPRPDPRPSPRAVHPGPARSDDPTRRWFLAGGAAVVLGAGAGTLVALTRDHTTHRTPNPPPAALLATAERERRLIADLDATTGGPAALRLTLAQARADHAEHLSTVQQLLRGYDPTPSATTSAPSSPSASVQPSGGASTGVARTAAQLRAAEQSAASAAAHAADAATGRLAVLLASISACESSHAALIG